MREPNKNFVYSLEDLTSEEFKELNQYLTNNEEAKWESMTFNDLKNESLYTLYWSNYIGWCLGGVTKTPTHNAKELFYTLENIQVDCRELTEEQIKEMADIFENAGYKIDKKRTNVSAHTFTFLRLDGDDVWCSNECEEKTTITYEKFMELFSNKEENLKKFTIREYLTGDFMDLGRDAGVITAKNKDHAWELYKETHKLKDSEKGFYSFTESATTSVVTKEGNNDLAEETSVYDDMLSLIEKGKQQGLKVAITFERL